MRIRPLENDESEHELLTMIAEGNEYAFRLFFNRYHKKVYHYALYILASDVVAEEVMQETMLKIWLLGKELKQITHLDSYLKKMVANRSFNALRRMKLEGRMQKEIAIHWKDIHNNTTEHIMLNDTRKVLMQAIALLPDYQKKVFELCHLKGFKYKEAAQTLNLSPHTVQTYMKYALRFVQDYVRRHLIIF